MYGILNSAACHERTCALRLALPSGVLAVGAEASCNNGSRQVARGSFCRTARRLFEGCVYA